MAENVTLAYIADVSALSDAALYNAAFGMMPEERKAKTARCRFEKDKLLSVGAWALLCYALEREGIDARELSFDVSCDGKPYIAKGEACFNLSHSGTLVMCAVSNSELGCDLEKIKDADMDIAERFFHENEYALIKNEADAERRKALFFRLWTLKESYVKATGRGLREPLSSFEISLSERISVTTEEGLQKLFFAEYTGAPGYAVSVCTHDGSTEFSEVDLQREVRRWKSAR